MRVAALVLLFAIQPASLWAKAGTRIEYGKARDLRSIQAIQVPARGNVDIETAVRQQLAEALSPLSISEANDQSGFTLEVGRKAGAATTPADESQLVTHWRLIRSAGRTVFVYVDGSSSEEDIQEVARAIVTSVVTRLQQVNPERFGKPAAAQLRRKPVVHSTAGLKPGMSKRDVYNALGAPLRVDGKHNASQIWTYETTEGTMRLLFSMQRLRSITVAEPKK